MLCVQRDRVEGCGIKMAFPSGAVNIMDFPVKCNMTSLVESRIRAYLKSKVYKSEYFASRTDTCRGSIKECSDT